MKFVPIILVNLFLTTSAAFGHEFWISPHQYNVKSDGDIVASLRSGQDFSGGPFSYLPPRFERFDLVQGDQLVAVEGRTGDRPALNMAAPGDGLWVIVHETKDSKITWDEWEKFKAFVDHKRLGNALEEHVERNLPDVGFRERYRRFAKSMVAVGNGQGQDREMGLRTEFVAQANPFTDDLSNGFPVRLLHRGVPRPGAQIEVFEKDPTGVVETFFVDTDAMGHATIPVKTGHEYLLDAVVLLPLQADDPIQEPVWESLWAALTFQVPE